MFRFRPSAARETADNFGSRVTSTERTSPSLLIVDDDEDLRELLVRALSDGAPRHIEQAASAGEARTLLSLRDFDVVITDLNLPGESGLTLMRWAQERHASACWIVITGYGTLDAAVEALQLGAFDFITKPIRGFEPLRNAVRNAVEQRRLTAERERLNVELERRNEALRNHVELLEEACRLLRSQADTIRADLRRAGIIQSALLPQTPPRLPTFHVHARYRPSQNVGGDLYDVMRLDERCIALLVADAAGHGLSAAMLAVLFRTQLTCLDPHSDAPREPRDVLGGVNRALCQALPAPGLFLTAAYCVVDTETRQATIASAGHPPVLWRRARGAVESVLHTGPALGLYPEAHFAQTRITLDPGDRLLMYSDGVYEGFPANGEGSGERIAAALAADPAGPFEAKAPAPQEDDATLLMLTAEPGVSLLDNGDPPPLTEVARPRGAAQTLVGSDARRMNLSVHERGDWTQSAAFYARCAAAIEAGRDVLVDLALCRDLDSTFLGTIHQLCELAEAAGVELRLQGVMPPVEALFEELGMLRVMEHMVASMLPLPTGMEILGADESDDTSRALLTLRAHEGLAALSDRNHREFDPLVAMLRKEVAALGR